MDIHDHIGCRRAWYGLTKQVSAAILLTVVCWVLPFQAFGGEGRYSRTAAVIFTVARFTVWPENAFHDDTSPLVLCSYRDKATGRELVALARNNTIQGRSLQYIDISQYAELARCHVVYYPHRKLQDSTLPVEVYGAYGVLTISDSESFAQSGGMLGFNLGSEGLSIYLNREVLRESGLTIRAGLLKLAEMTRNTVGGKADLEGEQQ